MIKKEQEFQFHGREAASQSEERSAPAVVRHTYDSIKPGAASSTIPQGRYEAIVRSITLQEPNDNGQSIRVNFEICSEGDYAGTSVPTWFKLYRADRSLVDFGVELWKRMLLRLGYEDVLESELPELLDQITKDEPGAIIKISYSKSKTDGNTYQRVEVEQPCDNDVVSRYKDQGKNDIPY